MQNPLQHQHWPFQTTFQSTKVIWDPHGGFRPKEEEKIQNFDIFFRADPPCQHINGSKIWSSLFCISWGYDLATIKPKTTSLNLSRNFRSNSGTGKNPAKCFQPETFKSPCIWLGNENGQKKMSSNEPKSMQNSLIHHH